MISLRFKYLLGLTLVILSGLVCQKAQADYSSAVLSNNPLGYWRLGESSGTNANDLGSGNNDGTYTGTYTLGTTGALTSSGDSDTAVTLSGGYVTVGDISAFEFTNANSFSIEAWVNPSSASEIGAIVGKISSGDGITGWRLYWDGASNVVALMVNASGFASYSSNTVFTEFNSWVHVVAVVTPGNVAFYKNGSPVGGSSAVGAWTQDTTGTLFLGRYSPSSAGSLFSGALDDIAIYSTALTPSQILAHYQAGITAPNNVPTIATLGPANLVNGSATTDTTPTFTFATADTDGDTVAYGLQVDNNSDFSSPTYAATSTYHAASINESTTTSALADGSYYWRVIVGDGTATSSYVTANSGSVAFVLDTAVPEDDPPAEEPRSHSSSGGSRRSVSAPLPIPPTPSAPWWNPLSRILPAPAAVTPTPITNLLTSSSTTPLPLVSVPPVALPQPLQRFAMLLPELAHFNDFSVLTSHSFTLPSLDSLTTPPPSDVYFASAGSVGLPTTVTIDQSGAISQSLTLLPNTNVTLTLTPEHPAQEVTGYLVLENNTASAEQRNYFVKTKANSNLATLLALESKPVEDRLVLSRFNYVDPEGDGEYRASLTTPSIPGHYEVITIVSYEEVSLPKTELRLTTVVDPEGYVFERVGDNDLHLTGVKVSLYVEDGITKQFMLWPAAKYGQINPQVTDRRGTYSFLVPAGRYYLTANIPRYKDYRGNVFTVEIGRGVHQNIELRPSPIWQRVWSWVKSKI